MDLTAIRRLVIISMFADDLLMERLVLKGGNALNLVHGIGSRSSMDVDLSLADDFEDVAETERRLVRALQDRFDSAGYVAFDVELIPRPANPRGRPPTWGGYRLEFKLIDKEQAARLDGEAARRRNALVVGAAQRRRFGVEISKYEYCEEKQEVELDGYTVYVYPPAMIAVEKLRAICQQMPEYRLVRNKRARARDFYDIYSIAKERGIALSSESCRLLLEQVFAAKEVPLGLIGRISQQREFHRPDWPSVVDSVSGELEPYDFYFDWVVAETKKLESLWKE